MKIKHIVGVLTIELRDVADAEHQLNELKKELETIETNRKELKKVIKWFERFWGIEKKASQKDTTELATANKDYREFTELLSKCNIKNFVYCNREVYDENDWKVSERKNKGGYHEQ